MPPLVASVMSLGRVAALTNSIIDAIAVLKLRRSMSSPTLAMVRCNCFSMPTSATAAHKTSPVRSSTASRHARCRKRNTPTISRVFHGFDASSGPMYISYKRNVSAPYSAITSSGLTTFRRLLDILATICVTGSPVAFSTH